MAEAMQRTLIAPRFLKCREQSLSLMFDMDALSSHVDFVEDPDLTLDISHICGTSAKDNVYIKYESFTQGAMVRGLLCCLQRECTFKANTLSIML